MNAHVLFGQMACQNGFGGCLPRSVNDRPTRASAHYSLCSSKDEQRSAAGGMAETGLGSTGVCFLLRRSHAQFRSHVWGQVPGQEWFIVGWCLAPGLGTALQVPVEPQPRIDLPQLEGGQDRKESRSQTTTPLGPGTVIVLPPQCWPTQASFREVVVHRDAWVIDEMRQSRPVFLQAG